jgi:hypothetical protein
MRRRLIALGLAGLLTFNAIPTPLFAADLGMPTKAAPLVAAPAETDVAVIAAAAAIAAAVALCIALCPTQSCNSPPC